MAGRKATRPGRWTHGQGRVGAMNKAAIQAFTQLLLLALAACQDASRPNGVDTSFKTAGTGCWKEWGVCATTRWRATGLVHAPQTRELRGVVVSELPERAEIIVLTELTNTCEPDPRWFRAEDLEMEALAQRHLTRRPSDPVRQKVWDQEEEELAVYRRRGDLDCSRTEFTLTEYALKDVHGLELYRERLSPNTSGMLDPSDVKQERNAEGQNRIENKLLVPRIYLTQISRISESGFAKRMWKNGMTLLKKQ